MIKRLPPDAASQQTRVASRASTAKKSGTNRIAKDLVALSSVAILSVYAIGYARTESAAAELNAQEGPADQTSPAVAQALAPTPTAQASATSQPASTSVSAIDPGVNNLFAKRSQPTSTSVVSAASGGGSSAAATPVAASTKTAPPTPVPARPTATPRPTSGYHDGTFVGTGFSRHGEIEATVVIQGGRIVSANVTGCGTRYPCSKVTGLVREVVQSQAVPVDYVSGATDSSNAYHDAVVEAVSQAKAS